MKLSTALLAVALLCACAPALPSLATLRPGMEFDPHRYGFELLSASTNNVVFYRAEGLYYWRIECTTNMVIVSMEKR